MKPSYILNRIEVSMVYIFPLSSSCFCEPTESIGPVNLPVACFEHFCVTRWPEFEGNPALQNLAERGVKLTASKEQEEERRHLTSAVQDHLAAKVSETQRADFYW